MCAIGLLLFAPTILFLQDQVWDILPGDMLTWGLILGGIGLALLALRQRATMPRVIATLLGGIALLAAQFYAIAALVVS